MNLTYSGFYLLVLTLMLSCTDPITVGSDLLNSDRAEVGEILDLPFTTEVVREDSLFTFNGATFAAPSAFTFGQIEDPDFGLTRHSVYLTPRLPRTAIGATVVPQFARRPDVRIDSVVVLIPIDTARVVYGPGRTFPYRAFEIQSAVSFTEDFYSNLQLPTTLTNIGYDGSFDVSMAAMEVRDTAILGRSFQRPHVRIRLSESFVQQANGYIPGDFEADSLFRDRFAGIYLEPDGDSEGLVTLAPVESSRTDTIYNGFNFYYTDTLGKPAEYRVTFLQALPNYTYNYAGSLVGELLADGQDSALVALAGQGGVMTRITFPDLSTLRDRVINSAVLEIPIAQVEGVNYADYPVPTRVELFYRATNTGPLLVIEDRVQLGNAIGPNLDIFLQGRLETVDGLQLYSPAFSLHMQRIVDEEVAPEVFLRVTPLARSEIRAARVLLNGPQAPTNPARVRITFTKLN